MKLMYICISCLVGTPKPREQENGSQHLKTEKQNKLLRSFKNGIHASQHNNHFNFTSFKSITKGFSLSKTRCRSFVCYCINLTRQCNRRFETISTILCNNTLAGRSTENVCRRQNI